MKPYAISSNSSRGRLHTENYKNDRNPFQRDRERLIHSMAFRRLEYKTQVFVNHVGDHYRTRLTHSLEVAQVARIISKALELNEDLSETIALAHDLGHPPFGHAGEDGLDHAAKEYGGFDHNVQAIKILTSLEKRYAEFDGLNLTYETIEGIIKHNGPIDNTHGKYAKVPELFHNLSKQMDISLDTFGSLEAQVAALADDIAYCNHDIDDGIRANMFHLEEIAAQIGKVGDIYSKVKMKYPAVNDSIVVNETIRRLMRYMIDDLISNTKKGLKEHNIETVEDVKNAGLTLVSFSDEVESLKNSMKQFLFKNVYRNYTVNRMSMKAKKLTFDLFNALLTTPSCLPEEWQTRVDQQDVSEVIIDYIAGMTDRYAIEEHRKIFDLKEF